MRIYGDTLVKGGQGRLLSALLISTALFLIAWNITIWMKPMSVPSTVVKGPASEVDGPGERELPNMRSYDVIVNKDVFNASRKKYVAPRKPKARKRVVRKAATVRTPRLTLLGTVILDDGKAAMISFQGRENDAKFYKVGDKIDGYTIKKIDQDSVLLKSGKRTLKVEMNPSDKKTRQGGAARHSSPFGSRGGARGVR